MKKWHKYSQILLSLFLLVGLLAPTALPGSSTGAVVHPLLVNIANDSPDQIVSVIVQVQSQHLNLEERITELSGVITQELPIINAFAAQLSAQAARDLASDPNVRWVSLDAPVEGSKKRTVRENELDPPPPVNYFLDTLDVRPVWEMGLKGQGITVAVIDSGTNQEKDLQVDPAKAKPDSRVLEQLTFNSNAGHVNDATGHGTHVAGIIGGSGYRSGGLYAGIAPEVNFVSLKISDDTGMAYESDAIGAMQWVLDHKDKYNIRAVNMSVNSTQESSYHTSPLDAIILWSSRPRWWRVSDGS